MRLPSSTAQPLQIVWKVRQLPFAASALAGAGTAISEIRTASTVSTVAADRRDREAEETGI